MKIPYLIIALSALSVWTTRGQLAPTQTTPYAIVERGANHRVWQKTDYEVTPDGRRVPHIHKYIELATGICYQQNGQWVDSQEQIDILPNGTAVANQGQHTVTFPGDIVQGVIELDTPDGLKLQSRPIALSYDDGSNSVLIAVLTNSPGYLFSSNQVIYPNAFTGIQADLLYTYTKAGFEQDIILRAQPPTPESFGLNPQTARLQVLTEFFSPPQPTIQSTALPPQAGVSLTDESIGFGEMQMIPGRAFLLGANATAPRVRVSKQWLLLGGRQFLVEEVPVGAISNGLATLPLPTVQASATTAARAGSRKLTLPPQRLAKTAPKTIPMARATVPTQGLVLDYQTITSNQTNYTFQGDTTYYVSGAYNLLGTTIFEGGTVIKLNGSGQISVDVNGTIVCRTASYRPAVFTSVNDNSVGQSISGSSGSPSPGDVDMFLGINCASTVLSGMRFSYGDEVITANNVDLWNCQIMEADFAIYGNNVGLYNVLLQEGWQDIPIWANNVIAENVTMDNCNLALGAIRSLTQTNCIATYGTDVSINGGAFVSSPNPIYQPVGGGSYYLTNGSPYRNAGTTNINPTLLAELQQKTTYPPIVYTNQTISTNLILRPQVPRDTNAAPDLGYHYDPLDYVFAETEVDSNITFTAGTAAGWYRTTSGWYDAGDGIHLMNGATANLTGTATAPVWWVRLNAVQEQDLSAGYGPGGLTSWGSGPPSYVAIIDAQFTHCSMMNNDANHFRDDGCCGGGHLVVNATDCEFYSTGVEGYYMTLNFTNCLFFRGGAGAQSDHNDAGLTLQNCTFYGSDWYDVVVQHWSGATWPVYIASSAFENCDFEDVDTNYSYYDYNAFIQGQNWLPISGAHDVIVTNSFNWQTSWLGGFYEPTNSPLLHKGNTNANLLGLYHFTTQTNQTVEGTNIVSIGYHYVAVDQYGNPLDSNGDGIPDYLEDANGNGIYDYGDLGDWQNTLYLKVLVTRPRSGSTLP